MKRLIIALALLATPAFAQQPAPTVEQVQEQAQALISAVQAQRNACQDQSAQTLASAQAQIAKLTKELEAAKAPKPQASDAIGVPSPGGGVQMKMQEKK